MSAQTFAHDTGDDSVLLMLEELAETVRGLADADPRAKSLARTFLNYSHGLRQGTPLPPGWHPSAATLEFTVAVNGQEAQVVTASPVEHNDLANSAGNVTLEIAGPLVPHAPMGTASTPDADDSVRSDIAIVEDENGQSGFDLFGTPPAVPATISTPPMTAPTSTTLVPTPVGQQTAGPTQTLSTTGPTQIGKPGWHVSPLNNPGGTSQAMFAKVLKSNGMANRLLWLVHDAGPAGRLDDELEQITDLTHQSVSAARRGMVIDGYFVDSGQRRLTRKGKNKAIAWVLTPQAQARIAAGLEKRPVAV